MAERLKIYKETDKAFSLLIRKSDGSAFPLATASDIKVVFPNEYTCPERFTVISKAQGGVVLSERYANKMKVYLTDAQTKNLRAGEEQSFEVLIKVNGIDSIVQFVGKLDVIDRLFPGA